MTLKLSVVVVAFDMARELPRTLASLAPAYQRDIAPDEYEVIVVDNGSPQPFDLGSVPDLPEHWRLIRIDRASPSPANAINLGLAAATAPLIGVMIDGARIATPGLLRLALTGSEVSARAVVTTLNWMLGWDSVQSLALASGYDQAREDELLAEIAWQDDGYRLFDIGAPSGSSGGGVQAIGESNALFMRRVLWDELDGVDERFNMSAGGFVNLDLLRRAFELPGTVQVVLNGEATFHQLHGDLTARGDMSLVLAKVTRWRDQYEEIRGKKWVTPEPADKVFLGRMPRTWLLHVARAIVDPVTGWPPPLGGKFDRELWAIRPAEPTGDAKADAAVRMAQAEFRARRYEAAAAVCRAARARFGEVPELVRILALASPWSRNVAGDVVRRQVEVHAVLGRYHELMGDKEAALTELRAALALDGDDIGAQTTFARLQMPGENYIGVLRRLHQLLTPNLYVEIGVAQGGTICLAQPPTTAIGIDPAPSLETPVTAETHIFALPSDVFFAGGHVARALGERRIDFAFIDGLHEFSQALRDFANVERWSTRDGMVVFHDTYPVSEAVQRRDRATRFWTGDVWKVIAVLRDVRPDLDIFTIATPPSGLTVVTRLDPSSRVLEQAYDEAIERYRDLPFEAIEADLSDLLGTVPSSWPQITERLARSRREALVG